MKSNLLIFWVVLSAGCSDVSVAPPHQTKSTVNDFERHIVMPEGAEDIAKYTRYYYFSGNVVRGEFVKSKDGAGRVIIVKDLAQLPHIMDGGCTVINLKGDKRHIDRAQVYCNGDA